MQWRWGLWLGSGQPRSRPQLGPSITQSPIPRIRCVRGIFSLSAAVSVAIKCQDQHRSLGWWAEIRGARWGTHPAPPLTSPVSGVLGLPRRVEEGKGWGKGLSQSDAPGSGGFGSLGNFFAKSPTGHNPHPVSEILDSRDRHKSLLGAVCCF